MCNSIQNNFFLNPSFICANPILYYTKFLNTVSYQFAVVMECEIIHLFVFELNEKTVVLEHLQFNANVYGNIPVSVNDFYKLRLQSFKNIIVSYETVIIM